MVTTNPFRQMMADLILPCQVDADDEPCCRRWHWIHSRFDTAIAVLVVLNLVVMAMYYNSMSNEFRNALDLANYAFLVLFAAEMVAKHIALGLSAYWKRAANAFDGCIVLGSVVLLVLAYLFPSLSAAKQVARLFRVGRLLRLVQRFPQLRTLFETMFSALPAMVNVTALMILIIFIAAITGVELFGSVS